MLTDGPSDGFSSPGMQAFFLSISLHWYPLFIPPELLFLFFFYLRVFTTQRRVSQAIS